MRRALPRTRAGRAAPSPDRAGRLRERSRRLRSTGAAASCLEVRLAPRDKSFEPLTDVVAEDRARRLALLDAETGVERAFEADAREPLHRRETAAAARTNRLAVRHRFGGQRFRR